RQRLAQIPRGDVAPGLGLGLSMERLGEQRTLSRESGAVLHGAPRLEARSRARARGASGNRARHRIELDKLQGTLVQCVYAWPVPLGETRSPATTGATAWLPPRAHAARAREPAGNAPPASSNRVGTDLKSNMPARLP